MRWDSSYGCNSCLSIGLILVLLLPSISLPFRRVTCGPQNPSTKVLALGTVSPPMHYPGSLLSIHSHWLGSPCLTSPITLDIILFIRDEIDFAEKFQNFSYWKKENNQKTKKPKHLTLQFLPVKFFGAKVITNGSIGPFPQTWGWQPGIAVIHCQSRKLRWGGKLLCYPWLQYSMGQYHFQESKQKKEWALQTSGCDEWGWN